MRYFTLSLAFSFCAIALFAQQNEAPRAYPPSVTQGYYLGKTAPLRDLQDVPPPDDQEKPWSKFNYFLANDLHNVEKALPQGPDPLWQNQTAMPENGGSNVELLLNFEGLKEPGVFPPDPCGKVGKNHYIQMVNASGGATFQVFDKQGNSLLGPRRTNTLWTQVNSGSIGDPIIQYDHEADRWIMLEMKAFGEDAVIMAITETSDPLGSWRVYRIPVLGFPDYPKFYIWNNTYFLTVNEIADYNRCAGYALERDALLAGKPNFKIHRFEMPTFGNVNFQPATGADWEAGPPPPPGSPAYLFRLYDDMWDGGQDQLQIWEIHVDWANANNSRIEGPTRIFPTPFETRVCLADNLFECIEQNGNAPALTALENILMFRAAYRNFGTHESVVLNHVTDVSNQRGDGGDAQMRWYELRRTPQSGGWYIYQEGTYAPDPETNRFMGTIAIDAAGSIGIGYSVCSQKVFPGLRLSGRRAGDPLGRMTAPEQVLVNGTTTHTSSRWGDYSSLTLDPVDGRTFWFTGEYQGASSWNTRIGAFRITSDNFDLGPSRLESPRSAPDLADETVQVSVVNGGLQATEPGALLSLWIDGQWVTTDTLKQAIPPAERILHVFSQKINLATVGKKYDLTVISRWGKDEFPLNDTLRSTVENLRSNDASIRLSTAYSAFICAENHTVPVVLSNTGAKTMTSADLEYSLNGGPAKKINWTGSLLPGASENIHLSFENIPVGNNKFEIKILTVNGLMDEDGSKNNAGLEFSRVANGYPLVLAGNTISGRLHWEIRDQNDVVLHQGDVNEPGNFNVPLCLSLDSCYRFLYYARSSRWSGIFGLYYLNVTYFEVIDPATQAAAFKSFCLPARRGIDIGIVRVISPVSFETLGQNEPITLEIQNHGTEPVADIAIIYNVNNEPPIEELIPGPLAPGQRLTHTFGATVDFSDFGVKVPFGFGVLVSGDENPQNNNYFTQIGRFHRRELEMLEANMSTACGNTSETKLRFTLRNNGLETVKSIKFGYSVNGVAQQPLNYKVDVNSSAILQAPEAWIAGSAPGINELLFYILEINGLSGDAVPSNDTIKVLYNIDPNKSPLRMTLITDEKPMETAWHIVDNRNIVQYSGGPYPFGLFPQNVNFCFLKDSCYTLRVFDAGNDGLKNTIELFHEGYRIYYYAGGNFGDTLVYSFCNKGVCSTLGMSVNVIADKPTPAPDGAISIKATGGTQPYTYSLNGGPFKTSQLFTGLPVGTYKVVCRDKYGCELVQVVEVKMQSSTKGNITENAENQLVASPNPTNGLLTLMLSGKANLPQEALCDVFGPNGEWVQGVRMGRWDDVLRGAVSLEKMPAGTYVLRVRGLAGAVIQVLRM